jgi:hypothetical protein
MVGIRRFSIPCLLLLFSVHAHADNTCSCSTTEDEINGLGEVPLTQCLQDLTRDVQNFSGTMENRDNCQKLWNEAFLRKQQFDAIKRNQGRSLFTDDRDFDDFYFAFSVGYEYASINKLLDKGFPRIGLLVYRRYNSRFSMEGNFLLTSSAEQPVTSGNNSATMPADVDKTLEIEIQPFYTLFREDADIALGPPKNEHKRLKEKIGITIVGGARKTDNVDTLNTRLYGGIRAAFTPDNYIDFLVGKTEGLESRRMEIRAQMPIFMMANGSRFYIGGIINGAVNHSSKNENDVIRIYVKWDSTNLSSLFF